MLKFGNSGKISQSIGSKPLPLPSGRVKGKGEALKILE